MPSFSALSIRDLVALAVICARAGDPQSFATSQALVENAFSIADAFVDQSKSRWAVNSRDASATKP